MHGAKFLIAAGGTGGHIFPGIEVARRLARRGHQCVFAGTHRGQEGRLVPAAGFEIEYVRTGALKGLSLQERLRTLWRMPAALLEATSILDRHRPRALLSLGGYASGPLMLMSLMHEIPILILDPNARPGLANRLAGPFASRALVCYPKASRYFPFGRTEVTGIPIREAFFSVPRRENRRPFTVLITGGSQGAWRLNQASVEALPIFKSRERLHNMRFIHQTGAREYKEVRAAYASYDADANVAAFFDDMPAVFAEADVVVCRAGASAVAELNAAGRASVLVPYPFASYQHQLANAQEQERSFAARVVLNDELTGERLVAEIEALWETPSELARMEEAARSQARPRAADRAAELMEVLAGILEGT